MRIPNPNHIILFIGIVSQSCTSNSESNDYETVEMYSATEIQMDYIPDEILKQTEYVKLKGDTIFGTISSLKIVDDKIYISDRRLKNLSVFDLNGDYISQLDKIGRGPGEYLQISDFDVDKEGNITIIDGQADQMIEYDSNYKHIRTIDLPFEIDIVKCLTGGNFLFGLSHWNQGEQKGAQIILTDYELNVLKTHVTYDEFHDDSYWLSGYQFSTSGDKIFYNQHIDNSVYVFSSEGEHLDTYEFDFGDMNVPNEDKLDIQSKLDKYKDYRCLIEFVTMTDEYAVGILYDERNRRMFINKRDENMLYLSSENFPYQFVGFDNNQIISFVLPGTDYSSQDFPEEVIKHLSKDNYVLALHQF